MLILYASAHGSTEDLWLIPPRVLESIGYAYVISRNLPNILGRKLSFREIGLFAGKVDPETIHAWADQVAADLEAFSTRR